MNASAPSCPPAPLWWRRLPAWARGLVIVLLTLVTYLPVLREGGWIWDDPEYILNNRLISNRLSDLWQIWVPVNTPQYYPLVFTTFWIEHNLWGVAADGSHDPAGYHLVNVLLHAANGVLVWRLFTALRVPWPWLIGAVFALHPLHVESAAWVTERKNTLSGFFYLLAALAYLRFDDTEAASPAPRKARWRWYAVSFGCFVLALLSKTVTSSLPAALILAMLFQRKRMTPGRLLPLAPMFALGLAMGMMTAWIERTYVGYEAFAGDQHRPWLERALVAGRALWFYPLKLLFPWPLIFNYPRWEIDVRLAADWGPAGLAVLLGGVLLWGWRRGWRGPFLALSLYAGSIFPAIGFVYVYPHVYSYVADHFCYLASLGVIALAAAGLARAVQSRAGGVAVAAAVLGACGTLSWLQGGDYRDEEWLWHSTLARNPRSWMAHNNLAAMYLGAGEAAMKRDQLAVAFPRLELAAEHAGQALALKPSHHRANLNRAEALHLLGRHAEAVKHFEAGLRILREGYGAASGRLRLFPVAMFYDHIGESLKALGQLAEAEKAFDQSLREDPFDFLTHHHYADLQLRLGRAELAAKHYQLVLRHLPPPAVTLEGPGAVPLPRRLDPGERRLLDAAQAAEQALAARFTGVKGLQQSARLRLVVFFALPPQPGFRDLHQARRLVSAAHLDTERPLAEVLALAAALLAQSGYLHDALAAAQESVRLAALQQSPTAPAMQAQRDALRAQLAPKP